MGGTYTENLQFQVADRVDREARVIRGLKILGAESVNGGEFVDRGKKVTYAGRNYAEVIQDPAYVRMYEGVPYIIEHTTEQNAVPRLTQIVGKITNPRVMTDLSGRPAIYGDAVMLNHPEADRVLEIADKAPEFLSSSHEVRDAEVVLREGKLVFKKIMAVDAVAAVHRGGTMRSIMEGREQMDYEKKYTELLAEVEAERAKTAAAVAAKEAELSEAKSKLSQYETKDKASAYIQEHKLPGGTKTLEMLTAMPVEKWGVVKEALTSVATAPAPVAPAPPLHNPALFSGGVTDAAQKYRENLLKKGN